MINRQKMLVLQLVIVLLGFVSASGDTSNLPAATNGRFFMAGIVLGALFLARLALIRRESMKLQPIRIPAPKKP